METAQKVETLMEAMPYLQKYAGKTVVIKYGGNAMINAELKDAVMHDIVLLKLLGMRPVLSHGGGPGINKMLETLNIPVQFINGLRYTSEDTMRVVEAVLVGQVNTELVGFINKLGGRAVGLSGVSGDIYHCHKRSEELGFVGDIDYVNADAINAVLDAGFIPVVAPVGTDGQGNTYNINGDTAAGKLASALGAEKLILLTDIEGLCNSIELRDVISYLNVKDVQMLKDKGVIAGGMIPKVDCCVQAIEEGVTSVHIIDGRKPHSILYEAFTTENLGTTIGTAQESVGIK
jgi:acetylglutamate kinase